MSKVVISRRVEPAQPVKPLSLAEFHAYRNRILIVRSIGGLGDILMHRMLFEDIKLLMPDSEVHFACPRAYHDAVFDHPFLDRLLDSQTLDKHQYVLSYNTSTICGRYEMKMAPYSDLHRSDIWASHCGIRLTRHNMHIRLSDDEKEWARDKIARTRDRSGPVVVFAPVSAMENKNLQPRQQERIVRHLWEKGLCPITLHNGPLLHMSRMDVPHFDSVTIRQWMSLIDQADYVISVDTAAFHCAGGLGKPLLGIFTFADGKIYGKYFNFVLVQKHRDHDPNWCGPCYNWCNCVKTTSNPKPCLTEITDDMLIQGVDSMLSRFTRTADAPKDSSQ